jgi:hypothetical protein
MPSKYEHLRTRLRLEQSRCLRWGEKVGLVEELLDETSRILQLNHNMVLDVLHQIQTAFRSTLAVTTKYEPISRSPILPVRGLRESRRSSFLQKTLAVWEMAGHVAGRLEWAMLKKEGFEQLIKQLIEYNDRIESLLDRNTLEELRNTQTQSHLVMLQMTEQVNQLQNLVQALQLSVPQDPSKSPTISRSSTLVDDEAAGYQAMISLAAFKARHPKLLVEENDMQAGTQLWIDYDRLHLEPRPAQSNRQLGSLGDREVWLEWQDTGINAALPHVHLDNLEDRMKELATILADPNKPTTFSAPTCLGYTSGQNRRHNGLALVFESPCNGQDRGVQPRSLREMMDKQSLSLNVRFELARILAESLLYLHAVNWIHKGVRSDNVLFHPGQDRRLKISEPILTGFEHARPALPEEFTYPNNTTAEQDIYRHPELLRLSPVRSKKSHDIYSLGLVLAEIAIWDPIESIVEIEVRKSKAAQVRPKMLDPSSSVFQEIAESAGRTYAEATRTCILGGPLLGIPEGADEEDPSVGAAMASALYQRVVLRLKSLKV